MKNGRPTSPIRTDEGWLYLATVLDLFSRQIVGWSMRADMTRQLVCAALKMAGRARRPPPGLLHHSDRGSQYCSHEYQRLVARQGMVASLSRKGDCDDNAPMERFFATLKSDRVDHRRYRTRAEARQDIFAYIAGFYNRKRRHSALSYMCPVAFEKSYKMWLNGTLH